MLKVAIPVAALTAAVLLAGGLSGCGGRPAKKSKPRTTVTTVATPDCDADDKAHNEAPDCGFAHAGKFYQWSWVRAGQVNAPAGWDATDAAAEQAQVTGKR